MKKLPQLLISAIIAVFIISSCGGGAKTIKNEFLGEIPSLEKIYREKLEKKEQELKESKDLNKAFKLSKEVDEVKEEWKQKVEEAFKAGLPSETLPFEPLKNTHYSVDRVTVTSASRGNMSLTFNITVNEDVKNQWGIVEKSLFIYYKAVDKDGNDIENSKTVAVNFGREDMTAGKKAELNGTWQSKAIANMEHFAAVKEITKEEYEKQ